MRIQISSGRGPAECCIAVGLLTEHILATVDGAKICKTEGQNAVVGISSLSACSIIMEIPEGSFPLGTVQWVCKSPLRPNHGRKNWFITVDRCAAPIMVDTTIRQEDLKVETFRSSGPGGQHVNKVSTGVRITHIPTGFISKSTSERSQKDNKKRALLDLQAKLLNVNILNSSACDMINWSQHDEIVRGDPVRTFYGLKFKMK